jgi:ABC-type nickel/cobalt efflux system permease component RcnA
VGHALTLMCVGGAVLILGTAIPASLDQMLELCVGVMLVVLGVDALRRVIRQRIHFHVHRHADGQVHFHAHSHAASGQPMAAARLPAVGGTRIASLPVLKLEHAWEPHRHEHGRTLPFRALAVGMMHGLAGSAALVVLSLQTVTSLPMGLGYIVVFGVGSVAGMAILSATIAIPLRLSGRHLAGMYRGLTAAIGGLTLAFGGWIVYRIGFAEGLILG